jgi:hypothetical protein
MRNIAVTGCVKLIDQNSAGHRNTSLTDPLRALSNGLKMFIDKQYKLFWPAVVGKIWPVAALYRSRGFACTSTASLITLQRHLVLRLNAPEKTIVVRQFAHRFILAESHWAGCFRYAARLPSAKRPRKQPGDSVPGV